MNLLLHSLNNIKNIHFIGISGISMSGIAVFITKNYPHIKITGSTDIVDYQIESIEVNGPISHLKKEDSLVVFTSGLKSNHDALKNHFITLGITTIHRMDLINILTAEGKRILVTGAHGKTSTSTYIYDLLKQQDYGYFIGALLPKTKSSAMKGKNYVIEGDESDKSFTHMKPVDYLIITNISNDHLDNYNMSFDDYLYTFESYLSNFNSLLIYNKNTLNFLECASRIHESSNAYMLNQLVERTKVKNISYGHENSDVNIRIIECIDYIKWQLTTEHLLLKNNLNEKIFQEEKIEGQWNIYNITAAIIVATLEGAVIPENISLVKPNRRMETIYQDHKKIIIDDYGVHPTEIYSVIDLCEKKYGTGKVLYIWQPHRWSRLLNLHKEFAMVFRPLGRQLLYTDIYNASENNIGKNEDLHNYIDYGTHITDSDLKSIINNKKHSTIILFNAGSLRSKVLKIIDEMKEDK